MPNPVRFVAWKLERNAISWRCEVVIVIQQKRHLFSMFGVDGKIVCLFLINPGRTQRRRSALGPFPFDNHDRTPRVDSTEPAELPHPGVSGTACQGFADRARLRIWFACPSVRDVARHSDGLQIVQQRGVAGRRLLVQARFLSGPRADCPGDRGSVSGSWSPRHLLPKLTDSRFMRAFVSKGRLSDLLASMPVNVVTARAALLGCGTMRIEPDAISLRSGDGISPLGAAVVQSVACDRPTIREPSTATRANARRQPGQCLALCVDSAEEVLPERDDGMSR